MDRSIYVALFSGRECIANQHKRKKKNFCGRELVVKIPTCFASGLLLFGERLGYICTVTDQDTVVTLQSFTATISEKTVRAT